MSTIELHFDTAIVCSEELPAVDGEKVLEKALQLQFRWLRIDWAGVVQVTLPVEDDVMFVAMAYAELAEALLVGQKHHVFLGDGLLDVTAERKGERIMMTVCHAPHLDRRLLDCKLVEVQLSMYLRAWRGLVKQLLLQLQWSD